ncbi:MAG: CPBP family intramembrane metalloprotease [Verrucomicrobia bacterium]|nr:CPBP family intramembrane metalloprotease [Verrucomicrobiota bacterium]
MLSDKNWRTESAMLLMLTIMTNYLFVMLVASLIFKFSHADGSIKPGALIFSATTLAFHCANLFFVAAFLRINRTNWSEAFGISQSPGWHVLGFAALATAVVLPLAWLLGEASAQILSWLNVAAAEQLPVQTLRATVSIPQKIIFGSAAIVVAPVGEELLFRGLAYPMLKQWGFRRFAWWGPSIFFATMHQNLQVFASLVMLALLLTWLYEKTGTLLVPILTHSLFNAVNFFWLLHERAPAFPS